MRDLVFCGLLLGTGIIGCSPSSASSPPVSEVKQSPSTTEQLPQPAATESATLALREATMRDLPERPSEGSVELVWNFNPALAIKKDKFLVFLSTQGRLEVQLQAEGQSTTGSNSSLPNFVDTISNSVKENPGFREPLIRVLDAYLNQTYEVKEGLIDPMIHSPEYEEQVRKIKQAL